MTEPDAVLDRIEAAAARVFGPSARIEAVGPLPGEGAGRGLLMRIDNEPVVAKLPERRGGSTIAVAEEYALIEALSRHGLSAPARGHDETTDILFTHYLEDARSWERRDIRDPGNIDRLAARLHELHAQTAPVRSFDANYFARAYGAGARDAAELSQLSQVLAQTGESPVLCHNDLIASNVLDRGEIVFIDFEYAAMAPPIVDLASIAVMNELDARLGRRLLDAYGNGYSGPMFDKAVQMQRLIARLWTQARETN